jgi:hypothetical protein
MDSWNQFVIGFVGRFAQLGLFSGVLSVFRENPVGFIGQTGWIRV